MSRRSWVGGLAVLAISSVGQADIIKAYGEPTVMSIDDLLAQQANKPTVVYFFIWGGLQSQIVEDLQAGYRAARQERINFVPIAATGPALTTSSKEDRAREMQNALQQIHRGIEVGLRKELDSFCAKCRDWNALKQLVWWEMEDPFPSAYGKFWPGASSKDRKSPVLLPAMVVFQPGSTTPAATMVGQREEGVWSVAKQLSGDEGLAITRGQFAQLMYEKLGLASKLPVGQSPAFDDVGDDTPGYVAIQALGKAGIMVGYPTNPPSFMADRLMTRYEAAGAVERLHDVCRKQGISFAGQFSDVADDHWAHKTVTRIVGAGILTGADGAFNGEDAITIKQAKTVLQRFLVWYAQPDTSGV